MKFTKEDLTGQYSWHAINEDNPKKIGITDNLLLNRKEGYEVLDFVNNFSEKTYTLKKTDLQKIEKMIREVPNNVHKTEDITNWIIASWHCN